MSPTIPFREISGAAVLEIGERLTEAPSRLLTDIAFSRELQAQQGLTRAIGWVDELFRHCHVWTAPADQGFFCGVAFDRGCGHVFGLLMRVMTPVGPDVVR